MTHLPDLNAARRNRAAWNTDSARYQTEHDKHLRQLAWGLWRIPEEELGLLGDVAGKDILELGCGGGQWSVELSKVGAMPVGMDNSDRQLEYARSVAAEEGVSIPFVHAAAERLPFAESTFDIVFCDYGAMTFSDPRLTVPEAARVLRVGGRFVFSTGTPFVWVCWPMDKEELGTTLEVDYFDMQPAEDEDGTINFQLPYGEWIAVFRSCGLTVEALVEPRPPPGLTTPYGGRPNEWARRWPTEMIWHLRKQGSAN